VPIEAAILALGRFKGIARRMQLAGEAAGVKVYDDFAHHPTAIATTVAGFGVAWVARASWRSSATLGDMRLGVHRATLAGSLAGADEVCSYAPADLGWDARGAVASLGGRAHVAAEMDELLAGSWRACAAGIRCWS